MRFPPAPVGQVQCPQCGTGLMLGPEAEGVLTFVTTNCPRCQTRLLAHVFPAIHRQERIGTPGQAALEGESTCFFHPAKRAAAVCDRCGRFLCSLCDLPMGSRHVCPKCLASGMEKEGPLPELLTRRVSWGRLALLFGLLPVLLGPFLMMLWFITGPAAVFCAIYGWRKPPSLVRGRRRPSAIIGLLLGLAQIAAVVTIFMLAWRGITRG